jgi:hypothetical protein
MTPADLTSVLLTRLEALADLEAAAAPRVTLASDLLPLARPGKEESWCCRFTRQPPRKRELCPLIGNPRW